MLAHDSADGPPAERGAKKISAPAKQRNLPQSVEDKIVSYIEVGIGSIEELVDGIGLLEANLERCRVNGMAPGVTSVNLEAMSEFLSGAENRCIVARVHVRQRKKQIVEATVSGCVRGQTRGIGSTARQPV